MNGAGRCHIKLFSKGRWIKMKVAFFDRDGTIIEDYPDKNWTTITEPVFMDGSIKTLRRVQSKGYQIIIITNQYLINEGYITLEQFIQVNNKMLATLNEQGVEILDVFYCPHGRKEGCDCIKPNTGMIQQAIDKYPEIVLEKSFMIGDSVVDVQLANHMGIDGYGIGLGDSYRSKRTTYLTGITELLGHL